MAELESSVSVWRKSSYSGGGNDCVEVALHAQHVGVRDSKAPKSGALNVSARGWQGLLSVLGRD